ncbi:glycerate kinase [Phormidium sp. FACHB-1136]|uniref:glycerate kinase n=1 Tax=Phormidium sp. FACHB-1136 TaxID=2692848 RepID=UPI0016825622|nr:glycerate kinase [Phormidium sp. FACHB-1136]MBD2427180.1 glycerate kinase [Phormidium sp. FACHB-1136]
MATDFPIAKLLADLLATSAVSPAQGQALRAWELADGERARAWGITSDTVDAALEERLHWLRTLMPHHGTLALPPAPLEATLILYWQLWLPLALNLKQARERQPRPLIQGILGGQGTGKTTLSGILRHILGAMDYDTLGFSIDDLYKTYADRQQLRQADPRLRWRGPPGTHDVDLGIAVLDHLRQAQPGEAVSVPRFDKSLHGGEGDRIAPEVVQGIDIVLFEGWFLGAQPLPSGLLEQQLAQAPDPIRTAADRQFARDMNDALAQYLPLWDRLDRLMILYPQDYRISTVWRQQAEQQMKTQGKPGMDNAEIEEFVAYFWRALHPNLFIDPLKQDRRHTQLVVEINLDRTPRAIYAPPE